MASNSPFPLVAVDIGNSRLKLADFEHAHAEALPMPDRIVALGLDWTEQHFEGLLPRDLASYHWIVASVNRPAATRFIRWLEERGATQIHVLTQTDLLLAVETERPSAVGIDRLANAVAVNRLRDPKRPAIVVDMGTAIKVDLVTAQGAFAGGAILPGVVMSSRALHQFTDLLPCVELAEAPTALGKNTIDAICAGLFWGAVGAVRELVEQQTQIAARPHLFLTGGTAPVFAEVLKRETGDGFQFLPHLTVSGIALAALDRQSAEGSR